MLPRLLRCSLALCLLTPFACADALEPSCSGTDRRLAVSGKLTVAADYSYPPFAFRGPDGELTGFEVDLMKEVAKEMKLEATFVNRGAGALVTGLLAHRHDVAASGLRATDELTEQACVSESYLGADLGVLVPSGSEDTVTRVRDLRGRTVATLEGSEAEAWALEELGRSTVASLPATDDLLTALQQKRVDAVVADLPFARFTTERSQDFVVAVRVDTGDAFVFATAKDNAPLMAELNEALGKIKGSKRFRDLERKWFG